MFKIKLKQLFLFVMIGFFVTACDDDSNPVAPIEHNDVVGLELLIDDIRVYKEFQQAYYDADDNVIQSSDENPITLNVNEEYEVTVHFLNDEGEELEELEGEEHDDELAVGFCGDDGFDCGSIVGDHIIEFHTEEHCDEMTDETNCNFSDHCEWNLDLLVCEDETDGGNHHELEFEIETSDVTGQTTFRMSLMHLINGISHPDFTSKVITVNVE